MTGRRVLVVNPGADLYGSDLQLLESISGLVLAGNTVILVCPQEGPLTDLARERGALVDVVGFPVVRRSYLSPVGVLRLGLELLRAAPRLLSTVRRHDPDAVYVNTTTTPWWIAAARLARVPVLCHVHEAEEGALVRLLNAPLVFADRLVLNSRTAAETLWHAHPGVRGRSCVVLNGLPDRPTPPVAAPADPRAPRLAVVGRLSPRKGTHTAIEALRLLVADGLDAHLEVAGSVFPGYEWYEAQLRRRVDELDLADHVTFAGYLNPPHEVYDRADVVLAPSTRESLGNVVIEAQLAQRPVVATASSGHLESVVHDSTGIHVPVGDASAMAEAVKRLVSSPDACAEMGIRARRSAQDLFGIDRYHRQIASVVASLGGPRGHRGRGSRRVAPD